MPPWTEEERHAQGSVDCSVRARLGDGRHRWRSRSTDRLLGLTPSRPSRLEAPRPAHQSAERGVCLFPAHGHVSRCPQHLPQHLRRRTPSPQPRHSRAAPSPPHTHADRALPGSSIIRYVPRPTRAPPASLRGSLPNPSPLPKPRRARHRPPRHTAARSHNPAPGQRRTTPDLQTTQPRKHEAHHESHCRI